MWRIYTGAILLIGGITAFIQAHRHIPVPARRPEVGIVTPASGLSHTAYDLLRLGGWALVIIGAITVMLGLIRYAVSYAVAKPQAGAEMSANGGSRPARPPVTARSPGPSGIEGTEPWDEGAHGEAVQPSPRR